MGRDELAQSLPCKAEENQVKTKDDIQSIFYNMAGLIGGKGIGIQGFSSKALQVFPVPVVITISTLSLPLAIASTVRSTAIRW